MSAAQGLRCKVDPGHGPGLASRGPYAYLCAECKQAAVERQRQHQRNAEGVADRMAAMRAAKKARRLREEGMRVVDLEQDAGMREEDALATAKEQARDRVVRAARLVRRLEFALRKARHELGDALDRLERP